MRKVPIRNAAAEVVAEALVDDADYAAVIALRWHLGGGYAAHSQARKGRTPMLVSMHRFIMKPAAGFQVDHVNGVKLDNRRSNLRICTQRDNARNRGIDYRRPGRFKGVTYDARCHRHPWRARVMVDGVSEDLGHYATEIEAKDAYDRRARIVHGEFFREP